MGDNPLIIKISEDFSDAPGARYRSDGPKSGEEFFDTLLDEKFAQAADQNLQLTIDFDGTYGYATSFLSESFRLLKEKYGSEKVLNTLELVSEEDPYVAEFTRNIIKE